MTLLFNQRVKGRLQRAKAIKLGGSYLASPQEYKKKIVAVLGNY